MTCETVEYGDKEEEVNKLYNIFRGKSICETMAIIGYFLAEIAQPMTDSNYEDYSRSLILTMDNARDRMRVEKVMRDSRKYHGLE